MEMTGPCEPAFVDRLGGSRGSPTPDPVGAVTCEVPRYRACDRDILSIKEVAGLLRCSVDTLRRIPLQDLPAYRIGRVNLYLRQDVIALVRSRPVRRSDITSVLAEVLDSVDAQSRQVLDSAPVDARRRSRRRTS